MTSFYGGHYNENPLYFDTAYSRGEGTVSVTTSQSFVNYWSWPLVVGEYYLVSVSYIDHANWTGSGSRNYSLRKFFNYGGVEYELERGGFPTYILIQYTGPDRFNFGGRYEVTLSATADSIDGYAYCSLSITPEIWIQTYRLTADEMNTFQNQQGVINGLQSNKDSIDKGNKLQEEENETSKGILGKITDFFGSFFENIINALKSLFIPEDGYFSDFFNRLNDLFSEKLGFLYSPIDLFVSFLNAIQNASVGSSPGLVFPELKWEDTILIPETTVNFDLVNEKIPDLQQKIYFVTDIIMVGAVIFLLERKIDEVMHK